MNKNTDTNAPQKMPIGIQSFEDLRTNNYAYVDKTAFVYRLVTTGKPYFLSRPRRFGKSLLLSTLEAYFLGKKKLFKDLAIEKLEHDWTVYPVLRLDLNAEKYTVPDDLPLILDWFLRQYEKVYGNDTADTTVAARFASMIRRAHEQTGKKVVVLIDEYDKPMLQAIENEELAEAYRSVLKGFYAVLKSSDEHLRFVFLTGVTKFSQVSIFSDLNQLEDLSMLEDFAAACGITATELVEYFSAELHTIGERNNLTYEETLQRMEAKYNGYHFHYRAESVFNPFSVLNALKSREFNNYWFQTGTPTFLVKLLKASDFDLRELINGIEMPASAFAEYRLDPNNPLPVIYQSGYLTIKGYNPEMQEYTLGFPNDEVKYGLLSFMLPFYAGASEDKSGFYVGKFIKELRAGEVDAFMQRMTAFFADFPYDLNDKTERHYQVVFYLIFKLMGQFIQTEVKSATGRLDAVVVTADTVFVFEFKLNGTAEEAIQQIDDKSYLLAYSAGDKKVVKIGVSFDKATRNIDKWIVG